MGPGGNENFFTTKCKRNEYRTKKRSSKQNEIIDKNNNCDERNEKPRTTIEEIYKYGAKKVSNDEAPKAKTFGNS